ncbi:Protein of unknown function DUF1645, plant [Dillenia turbinata]|uniref:FHA domain-containing protein n=1 Tax=Dillenia turbinata TaxID=194707 RepID=A0AAN8US36_9MAGN
MEMEVVVPVPAGDFNFDSRCSTPYISAPSSPQRFGNFFFSPPTSPTSRSSSAVSPLFRHNRQSSDLSTASTAANIPFNWEEKPGTPKSNNSHNKIEDDFAFDFSGNLKLDRSPLLSAADELFDGGKIKPLKPPPGIDSPKSPKKKSNSPRNKKDLDPFEIALNRSREEVGRKTRARDRSLKPSRKISRSHSPLRVSDVLFETENQELHKPNSSNSNNFNSSNSNSWSWNWNWISGRYKKWKLRDFLLFRSASESRATTQRELLRKHSLLSSKRSCGSEDVKNSSFRSTDSSGSISSRRRSGPVSAHELHYTLNRAVSEEMRKRTFLPYKQGLLGCLGFNPAVHELSKSFGSLTRGRNL